MLESIDPHWRATRWLQLAVRGITEEEIPWYELVIPLMLGAEGAALSLARHLLAVGGGVSRCAGRMLAHPP